MNETITAYISGLPPEDQTIGQLLATAIDAELTEAESKIWHGHPVWFIEKNPIVGFSRQKAGIRLMFWSDADFEDEKLSVRGGKFKDASIFFHNTAQIDTAEIRQWLGKSRTIQWNYRDLVKKKGLLERLI